MLRNIVQALKIAAHRLFGSGKTTLAFVILYAAFVFSLYLFFTTPEARMWQVGLTILLLLVIPILFFVLQAMGLKYTWRDIKFSELVVQAWREFWKLLVISLPIILVAWILYWGLSKLDSTLATGWREAAASAGTEAKFKASEDKIKLLHTVVSWLTTLLLYFIVPLLSIQLWISTLGVGLKQTLKSFGRVILRAYAPRAVVTYLLGFLVFGLLPYYIITTRTPIKSPWMDLSVLGIRIALALLVILVGWVITLGAMNILTTESTRRLETMPAEQV